ncbi:MULTISPECIES: heme/hemin ABC transporter substrate-binding protein [unclassified Rhodococcus (in: high G+C Gram-positive bacteria)]|uniref:heme/hemin ABC transporter substrate-binding protein n=1 Tax=unclassified Rhodococcus (in: high G+C Gram-positive bacteria) TaxID=192944 RepID=UPI00096A6069|nr:MULTISPECIES: ABC transporter substrate-binding protein [unclassified Rhodococcus (in: high G+C Gram-positive bacteria)]
MMKRLAAAALVAAAGFGLVACGSSDTSTTSQGARTAVLEDSSPVPVSDNPTATLPLTVKSFDGVDVTITDNSRIVAADRYGTLATTTVALGLGDNLVGRDTAAKFPAVADVPVVTVGGQSLNTEAILDLNPTVVLTDTSIGPKSVQDQLRAAGVPVVFFDPTRTLEGVPGQLQAVADALGVPAQGAALVDRTESEIAKARDLVPTEGDPLKIAFLYMRGSAITMIGGEGSGADSLIEALGATDAGTASGITQQFVPITSEALIAAAPDALLMMTDGLASIGGIDGLEKVPGIAQTPAGKNKRVVDMADGVLLSFGPNTGRVMAALAEAIYEPGGS